jgi:sporulation protein YlmC with PRC-barrel domain
MRAGLFVLGLCGIALCTVGGEEPAAAVCEDSTAQMGSYIRLSKFIGSNVETKDAVGLGKIEDVVVNPKTREVQFALVGKGEFSGVGDKLMHVPWRAMNIKAEKEYTIRVDRQQLSTLPAPDTDAVGKAGAEVGAEGGAEIRSDDPKGQK